MVLSAVTWLRPFGKIDDRGVGAGHAAGEVERQGLPGARQGRDDVLLHHRAARAAFQLEQEVGARRRREDAQRDGLVRRGERGRTGEARDRGAEVVVVAGLLDELHHLVGRVVGSLAISTVPPPGFSNTPKLMPAAEKSMQLGAVQVPVLPEEPPLPVGEQHVVEVVRLGAGRRAGLAEVEEDDQPVVVVAQVQGGVPATGLAKSKVSVSQALAMVVTASVSTERLGSAASSTLSRTRYPRRASTPAPSSACSSR